MGNSIGLILTFVVGAIIVTVVAAPLIIIIGGLAMATIEMMT